MSATKPTDGLEPLMPYSIPSETCGSEFMRRAMKRVRWLANSAKLATLAIALGALVISGCAKTITIKPECEIPQLAPLPVVMSDDMEMLADDVYWALSDRERLLTDWALEMEATLEALCK